MELQEIENRLAFINNIELGAPSQYAGKSSATIISANQNNSMAKVVNGSIIYFDEKMTNQQCEDVMFSTLFAQLTASKQYNRNTQFESWYRVYFDVLNTTGWSVSYNPFKSYKSTEAYIQLSYDVMRTMKNEAQTGLIDGLNQAVEALYNNQSSRSAQLFDTVGNHTFQALVTSSEQDMPTTTMGIFSMVAQSYPSRQFLFSAYPSSRSDLFYNIQKTTLNTYIYNQIREIVKTKLGPYIETDIAPISF